MSFELARQLQEKAVAVDQLCRVLKVSRSGYYAARQRSQVQPSVCETSVHLKAAFAASGGSLRQPAIAHGSGLTRRPGGHLPRAPSDAPARPAPHVETQVRAHHRQQACPADLAQCTQQAVQSNGAESGLGG